jgi:TetR/AcrR family transcriptional regulator, transcriptional repressor for nem operon
MAAKPVAPSGDTAQRLTAVAMELIQTRGFSAISYQDLADRLNIRKASIHYHFPSKTDLGVAVLRAYVGGFAAALAEIDDDPRLTSAKRFDRYCEPFRALAATPDKVCMCGALSSELFALPEEMRPLIKSFFAMHESWLTTLIKQGIKNGEFRRIAAPEKVAHTIFAALQGSLLVRRTVGEPAQTDAVIATLRVMLLQS